MDARAGRAASASASRSAGAGAVLRRRNKKTSRSTVFWVVVALVAVAMAGVAAIAVRRFIAGSSISMRQPASRESRSASAPPPPVQPEVAGEGTVDFEAWEAEFESALWTGTIPDQLKVEPYLFSSSGALVKEVVSEESKKEGRKYRVLMFDQSGEVQGAVAYDLATNQPVFQELALEYVQSMAVGLMFSPLMSCGAKGRALVLGLGAGSIAGLLHDTLRNYHVDVVEISDDVRRAAEGFLGAPTDSPRFKLHMQDALTIFDSVPTDARYDVIVFDAYMPGPAIPPPLATAEYVQLMASRLTPDGIVVLNFCLPFYNVKTQLQVMAPYRASFRHLHVIEATPTSKVLVAYNSPTMRPAADVATQLDFATAQCGWPSTRRGLAYHYYLESGPGWEKAWPRAVHQEASKRFCIEGKLSPMYCNWFMPRHRLAVEVPEAYFGGMEQEMALRKSDNNWRKAVAMLRAEGHK